MIKLYIMQGSLSLWRQPSKLAKWSTALCIIGSSWRQGNSGFRQLKASSKGLRLRVQSLGFWEVGLARAGFSHQPQSSSFRLVDGARPRPSNTSSSCCCAAVKSFCCCRTAARSILVLRVSLSSYAQVKKRIWQTKCVWPGENSFPKQCYLKMSFIVFLKTHVLAKSLLLDLQDLLQLVALPKCLVWGFVRPALLHDKKTQCLAFCKALRRFSCLDLENKFVPLFSGLQFGVEIFPRFPKHLVWSWDKMRFSTRKAQVISSDLCGPVQHSYHKSSTGKDGNGEEEEITQDQGSEKTDKKWGWRTHEKNRARTLLNAVDCPSCAATLLKEV